MQLLRKIADRLKTVRQPGIEPGSIAWKATMLTFTPPTPYQIMALFKNQGVETKKSKSEPHPS